MWIDFVAVVALRQVILKIRFESGELFRQKHQPSLLLHIDPVAAIPVIFTWAIEYITPMPLVDEAVVRYE